MSANLDVEFYMETGSFALLDYVSLDINGEVSMLVETDIVFTASTSVSYQQKTAFGPYKLSLASAGLSLLGFSSAHTYIWRLITKQTCSRARGSHCRMLHCQMTSTSTRGPSSMIISSMMPL